MSELADVERRIAAALERIGARVEMLQHPSGAPGTGAHPDLDALAAELDQARAQNAELTERVTMYRRKLKNQVAALEARVARLTEQADSRGIDLQRLRRANDDLVAANRALLAAQEDAEAAPAAVNRALAAELEALRAARRAESDEVDTVMAELDRLMDVRKPSGDAKKTAGDAGKKTGEGQDPATTTGKAATEGKVATEGSAHA